MLKFIGLLLIVALSSSFKLDTFSNLIPTASRLNDVNWPFTICGKGTWTVKSVTLKAAPVRNSNNTITMIGVAGEYVEFKGVDINVKLNGLFLHSQFVDWRREYEQGDQIEFVYNNFIPSFAPSGTYQIQFTHRETSGKQNGCWSITFKL